jgi:outer membrane biogenesis lipoprotein LolB
MIKQIKWILLIVVLLWLTGCTHTSEAKVHVVNKGTFLTYVNIYYTSSQIKVGESDTFTLSWPGRGDTHVVMLSYPVGQPNRYQNQELTLSDGDDITVYVEFN